MWKILLLVFVLWIFLCKVIPFILYPNYLIPSKVEKYSKIKNLSRRLKSVKKEKTLENIYNYFVKNHRGKSELNSIQDYLTLLEVFDFKTEKILGKKRFLWCHTQNRMFKSILINTGQFKPKEVRIQRIFFKSTFIHQYLLVTVGKKVIKIDPVYKIYLSI
jgi:hypothetical protein